MKTLLKTLSASILSMALIGTAFAAPQMQDNQAQHNQHTQATVNHQQQQKSTNHSAKNTGAKQNQQYQKSQSRNNQSSQSHTSPKKSEAKGNQAHTVSKKHDSDHWSVGSKVPTQYHSANYKVGYQQYKLAKPVKNQRWIKVNGDYFLENMITHTIVKVIRG